MAECQTCGGSFDESAYQVIVWGLGSFDSVECAEKALQRRARRVAAAATLAQTPSQPAEQSAPLDPALDERNSR